MVLRKLHLTSSQKLFPFAYFCKYYVAPIEGLYSVLHKGRDYRTYVDLVRLFIDFCAATTSSQVKKVEQQFYQIDIESPLLGYLQEFYIEAKKAKKISGHNLKKRLAIESRIRNSESTEIDKINGLVEILTGEIDFVKIPPTDYSALKESEELEDHLGKLLKFIELFKPLHEREEKTKDDRIVLIIASLEFFNFMHHFSVYLDPKSTKDAKRKNIERARGHLERAGRDINKLNMYIRSSINLETLKHRVEEIKNTGLED